MMKKTKAHKQKSGKDFTKPVNAKAIKLLLKKKADARKRQDV